MGRLIGLFLFVGAILIGINLFSSVATTVTTFAQGQPQSQAEPASPPTTQDRAQSESQASFNGRSGCSGRPSSFLAMLAAVDCHLQTANQRLVNLGIGALAGEGTALEEGAAAEKLALEATGDAEDAASAAAAFGEAGPALERTIALVRNDGPFPYAQDGSTFRNVEGKLPPGNYREYTVATPGAEDRGARRLVVDQNTGSMFYTNDHYFTFFEIVESR